MLCAKASCSRQAVTLGERVTAAACADTIDDATLLWRSPNGNNKVQDMTTTYAQSDYSNKFSWFGLRHDVLTGVDAAEAFRWVFAAATLCLTIALACILALEERPLRGSSQPTAPVE